MPVSRTKMLQALQRKGFRRLNGKKHIQLVYYDKQGRSTQVDTQVSRGSSYKTLGAPLLGAMARQCHLSRVQFRNLVDCPMSRDDYEEIIFSPNE